MCVIREGNHEAPRQDGKKSSLALQKHQILFRFVGLHAQILQISISDPLAAVNDEVNVDVSVVCLENRAFTKS